MRRVSCRPDSHRELASCTRRHRAFNRVRLLEVTTQPFIRRISSAASRRRAVDALSLALALAVGAFVFAGLARASFVVGPATLVVSAAPALSPATVVEMPPFGRVSAATHRGPVEFRVRLEEIDVSRTRSMIERGQISIPETLTAEYAAGLPGAVPAVTRAVGIGLLAAGLASAVMALALRRRARIVVAAFAIAIIVPGVALGAAYSTYNIGAFEEPRLEGGLAYAPGLINVFSAKVASIDRLRDQAVAVARDVAAYYADDRTFATSGPLSQTYRVVHITDLHLDPVGAELARQITRSYEASLVIDTGDLPILGAPVESPVYESLVDRAVRRIYVPGNHDSPSSLAELDRLGVEVLTSGTVEVDGLRIFGVPDPVSRGFGVEPDPDVINAAALEASTALRESLAAGEPTPTIIAIHNPSMERGFIGMAPLIISGHTHAARLYVSRGTVRLNSGTLGGMPYDPRSSGRKVRPHSVSVLYYSADLPRRLIAIDRIAVSANRSSTVARDLFDETLPPE